MKEILILNGPNLNLLGKREPDIYGNTSFDSYFKDLQKDFPDLKLTYFQSNSEGELIDTLHVFGFSCFGIVFNPAAYTHYSYALADAIKAITTPVVEVHISNIMQRESFRKVSVTATNCIHQIHGKGLEGYKMAIKHLTQQE